MTQVLYSNTIVALSTPAGSGALGVIRLSGPEAITIIQSVFKGKDLREQKTHTLHFGLIMDGEAILDEVVVGLFLAPKSYTKENVVEISCHGSDYIIKRIISLLVSKGARPAKPGEFTLQAFLNGAFDLSKAEAVADLIASNSKASHDIAMQQMRGGFSNELQGLREKLIHFASMIELELDFSEEDVEFANRGELERLVADVRRETRELMEGFSAGNAIKNGIPVAIVGAPNVGKSTLLNALLREDRAIVSPIAGATRDLIEDVVDIGGVEFRFIDTAGIRDTGDTVESMGIERALRRAGEARVVLFMVDANT